MLKQSQKQRAAIIRATNKRFTTSLQSTLAAVQIHASRLGAAAAPFTNTRLDKLPLEDQTASIGELGEAAEEAVRELENTIDLGRELARYFQSSEPVHVHEIDAMFGKPR